MTGLRLRLPEGIGYLCDALRGRKPGAGEWLAVGKMLRIPRFALLSFRWRIWRNPGDVAAWFHAAHIHRHVFGEYDRALALYDRALAANPNSVDLWKAKGDLLAYCGMDRPALEAYDRALALSDEKVPLLIETSRVYFQQGDHPDQALVAVDAALAIAPEHIPALAWKRSLLRESGRREEGEALNDRILDIDPKHAGALLHRAHVFRKGGKGDLALGVYDAFLFHHPDRRSAWELRSGLLLELHRYPDALESVEKAISLDPEGRQGELSPAEELRGDILAKLQRYGDAIAAYDRVLARDPSWHPAAIREKVAVACFLQGDYPGTVAACDQAIALAGRERRDTTELCSLRDAAQKKMQGKIPG